MGVRSGIFASAALAVAACVGVSAPAASQTADKPQREIRLDLDGDGKLDLARVVGAPPRRWDLHVFMGVGDDAVAPERQPDIVKQEIAENFSAEVRARGRSLVVTDDCGGCTINAVTSLTIVHRQGALIVAGLDVDWEIREDSGRCGINFLTGKGAVATPSEGRPVPIRKKLSPRPLASWDFYDGRELCEPPARRR
jgi:hypothetical protein